MSAGVGAAMGTGEGWAAALTERWYRMFLRAFPAGHRGEYGAEVIGTLMAGPARRVPSPRETAGLVTAGFAARFRKSADEPAPWWADGVQLGMLALALANLAYGIGDRASMPWLGVSALMVLALLRGWAIASLPLALAIAFSTARAMMFGSEAASWGSFYGPAYWNWSSLAPYGLLLAGSAVLAARGRHDLRTRPWWWLAVPIAAALLTHASGRTADGVLGLTGGAYGDFWQFTRAGLEGVLLLAGVWATALARSPRWALAAAMYVVPGAAAAAVHPPNGLQGIGYWLTLPALVLVMVATAARFSRVREAR
ncbi:hypothetical protein [Actinomadura roseirufa]|uniref:hypothetical protein n=1 Tax=Actinomadura roseirufa TaxID=2094049 RepID=UPI0010415E4A|nr:hypothetical protein [Actinomadura roseirufa]